MTNPTPVTDKATDELRLLKDMLWGHKHGGLDNTDAIVGLFSGRDSLAAVPASEPAGIEARRYCKGDGEWTDWAPMSVEGRARHKNDPTFEFRYTAAPAPVSGMPDLASLPVYERMARGRQDLRMEPFYAAADVERILNPTGETK